MRKAMQAAKDAGAKCICFYAIAKSASFKK